MAVAEGKFVLYSRIEPPLPAGDYRLTSRQRLSASNATGALPESALPTHELPTHVRVRSPRFALPPDQVLSTFPPANSDGSFGMRLAQIVIKRRTLPWERLVAPTASSATPWLALVLIAEGEAELHTNQPAAECITPGVALDGEPDVEKGSYLLVSRSIVEKVFPTRLDVPLLAHAREVDIHDTELMMGDDDGFLAVVVSNRLPLPGRDADGREVPQKYLAALINLEGQFDVLLPKAPEPLPFTVFAAATSALSVDVAAMDHVAMGRTPSFAPVVNAELAIRAPGAGPRDAARPAGVAQAVTASAPSAPVSAISAGGAAQWSSSSTLDTGADVYLQMAEPFARAILGGISLELTYRFPVLLHWSFTSSGGTTFRKLMADLDAGLLGTVGAEPPPTAPGRPPLEVVETGHVGLAQRTRRGDEVRAWYRGPFVPHPTTDPPGGRLPLAHASDQLRVVVPDGREDLSLASAFEIGRLLALARPSMVAALLRWRQLDYQTARREAIWGALSAFLGELELEQRGPALGRELGRVLARKIALAPEVFLGAPRALVDPGRPLEFRGSALELLASGLGVDAAVFDGDLDTVRARLRATPAPVVAPPRAVAGIARGQGAALLGGVLDQQLVSLVADAVPGSVLGVGLGGGAFGTTIDVRPGAGVAGDVLAEGVRRGRATRRSDAKAKLVRQPDALDRLVEALGPRKKQP